MAGYVTRGVVLVFSIVLLSLPIIFAATGTVHAQCESGATGAGGFVPLECFEQSSKLKGVYTERELGPFLQKVFVGAISLGAMLAVLRLAWAGFIYMGTDLWSDKQKARDIIKDTLLGLFLLIAIWLILHQINPDILKLEINTRTPQTNTNGAIVGG